jgi:hypothetical protein
VNFLHCFRHYFRHRLLFPLALVAGLALMPAAATGEPVRLVDSPTAGLVAKGRFAVDMRFFPDGGVLGQLHAGVLTRLTIGLSFGGERLIGSGSVDWQPRIEPTVRYRIIEENQALPALVLGYDSQGRGPHTGRRYQVKSKGFFAALSKNYLSPLGQFGIHTGINRSREDGDDDLSGWIGVDKSVNKELWLSAEYDLGRNDGGLGQGDGYLNWGAHWSPAPGLTLDALLKDALGNGPAAKPSRELGVRYTEAF